MSEVLEEQRLEDKVLDVLKSADKPLGPKDLAAMTDSTEGSISNLLPLLKAQGKVTKKGRGNWMIPTEKPEDEKNPTPQRKPEPTGESVTRPNKRSRHARGNVGIIFVDVDSGKEFFGIEFPDYMPVFNTMEVRFRFRNEANGNNVDGGS